jgi:alpha-glucoside transport system permease protein
MPMGIQSRDQVEVSAVRRFAPVLAALIGIAVVAIGVVILLDRNASSNVLASIYDAIGNTQAAEDLRRGVGDQLLAKLVLAGVALVVGVGGIWMLYMGVSAVVGLLSPRWQGRILPWVFVIPAMVLLTVYLVYPTIGTIITSFTFDTNGDPLANYKQLTSPLFLDIIRNNIIWLIVGTGGTVLLGLLIAGLFDRVRRESLAKTFVFLPLAISFVGASVIWRFMYEWKPAGKPQIGTVNAVWTALGQDPVRWVQEQPINTYALIFIFIWLQTGFAMVVLSAAIKGVSTEVIEAARLDGASERQLFLRVVVPMIRGSIITVATTIAIVDLKVFDIIYVMTGGRNGTDVIANRMFQEFYEFFNDGRAAALATLLFLAVLPVMFVNVRNLRRQGVGA